MDTGPPARARCPIIANDRALLRGVRVSARLPSSRAGTTLAPTPSDPDRYNPGPADPAPMSDLPAPAAHGLDETAGQDHHFTAEEAQALLQSCYTQYSLKLHDV